MWKEGHRGHYFLLRTILVFILLLGVERGCSFTFSSLTRVTSKTRILFSIASPPRSVSTTYNTETRQFVQLKSSLSDEEKEQFWTSLKSPINSSSDEEYFRDSNIKKKNDDRVPSSDASSLQRLQRLIDEIPFLHLLLGAEGRKKLPPLQVDDTNLLLYDVFLIVNLSLSISFWVTHRLDFTCLPFAFNEGCLFSILWIAAGLVHGSFLHSAMDGHYPPNDSKDRGGPKAAAALAFNTYINAINLRLIAALVGALVQHRQVGGPMEELLPLEIGCGLVLMTLWRALHSSFTPRI